MRKLALLSLFAAASIAPTVGPKPKIALLFTLKNHTAGDEAVSLDGRRIYYVRDSTDLFMYDRTTRKTTHALGNMWSPGPGLAVSPLGDRLAFCKPGEEGDGPYLWTVALDPSTGLPTGAPRRVSLVKAMVPAFSPDGKSIAFATPSGGRSKKNIFVVPAGGGPERVVADMDGDVWPIRWIKKDSIDFGLSFGEPKDAGKNGVYRVPVSGGAPNFVMRTGDWGSYPGLSPDGRSILAADSTWDSVVVATAAGKRIHAYEMTNHEATPDVWLTATHAVGWQLTKPRVVHVMNFADGKDRVVSDSSANYLEPQWSPDGRHISSLLFSIPTLFLTDANGGARRAVRLYWPAGFFSSVHWSPDGRSIFYRERRSPGALNLVDVASGKWHQLASKSTLGPIPHWRGDSRAILYAIVDSLVAPDSMKTIEVHEITTDGHDRVLHTVKARCSGGQYCGKFVDDSLLATWADGDYSVTNFRTRGTPRIVFKREGAAVQPVASFSSDGRWMAVRQQTSDNAARSIVVMKSDGSARKTVSLSFPVASGEHNPWIRPDGAELIVASGGCGPRAQIKCATSLTFYRVDVATGKATAIATTPGATRQDNDYRVSPDGRSLVYMVDLDPYVDFFEFDYSELLKP